MRDETAPDVPESGALESETPEPDAPDANDPLALTELLEGGGEPCCRC
ncbi:hypothetical protein ACU686_03310 [Yinghuangia aomiensis]